MKYTDLFYEGIISDTLNLTSSPVLKGKSLSDDIKEGIDTTLDTIEITPEEMEILSLRYDSMMNGKEIGELKGIRPQKVAATVRNICTRIRTSPKMMYFLRGQHEGEINEFYASSLFNFQKNLSNYGGYEDYSKDIKALELRYLGILGVSNNQLLLLYKEGYTTIEEFIGCLITPPEKVKKVLGSRLLKKLKDEFSQMGLI